MQRCVAAMVASSALFLVVALAVLEPAAGFAGPNALLPLRARWGRARFAYSGSQPLRAAKPSGCSRAAGSDRGHARSLRIQALILCARNL